MGKKIIIKGADFSDVEVKTPIYYYKGLKEHNNSVGSGVNISNGGFGLNKEFCENIVGEPINFIEMNVISIGEVSDFEYLKLFKTDSTYSTKELVANIKVKDSDVNKLKRYYFDTFILEDGEYLAIGDSSNKVTFGYYASDSKVGELLAFSKFNHNTTSYAEISEKDDGYGYPAAINIGYYETN